MCTSAVPGVDGSGNRISLHGPHRYSPGSSQSKSSFDRVVTTGEPTLRLKTGCPFNTIEASGGFAAVVQAGALVGLYQWVASPNMKSTTAPGSQTSCDEGITNDPVA